MSNNRYSVPYGLDVTVCIRREEDGNAYVDVHAPFYVNKKWTMSHCYGDVLTDQEILRDSNFHTVMINHYPARR